MLIFFLVLNNPVQKNTHPHDQNGMSDMLKKKLGLQKTRLIPTSH